MHSIHRQRRLKEKQENEERRTFPVCRAYRQPDAISGGGALARRDTRGGLTNNPSTRRTHIRSGKCEKMSRRGAFIRHQRMTNYAKQHRPFMRQTCCISLCSVTEPEGEKSGERVEMAELCAGTIIGARSEVIRPRTRVLAYYVIRGGVTFFP